MENMEKAQEQTRKFLLRDRMGWLRSLAPYLPPVLRERYLATIDELKELIG